MFYSKVIQYIQSFNANLPKLPKGISFIYPYQDDNVMEITHSFYQTFYGDTNPRKLILGINPGRLGGGVTGIPFTDSYHLKTYSGIDNPFTEKEISSEFVYTMIQKHSSPKEFYGSYFIASVCPLGFIKDGKNMNYYDDKTLIQKLEPYIFTQMAHLLKLDIDRSRVYCLGEGANFKQLSAWNKSQAWFGEIIPLAHPRYIMQYKRKSLELYLNHYLKTLC